MLDNRHFNAPVAANVKNETEMDVDVELKMEDRRRTFVQGTYSTGALSAVKRPTANGHPR